jgi:hypothetical protein
MAQGHEINARNRRDLCDVWRHPFSTLRHAYTPGRTFRVPEEKEEHRAQAAQRDSHLRNAQPHKALGNCVVGAASQPAGRNERSALRRSISIALAKPPAAEMSPAQSCGNSAGVVQRTAAPVRHKCAPLIAPYGLSVIQQSNIMQKLGAKIELFDNLKGLFKRKKPGE